MIRHNEEIPSAADHAAAFTEVSFLLDIFANTIEELMGGATASVGRIAGREIARKIPMHIKRPNREEAIRMVAEKFNKGFTITHQQTDKGIQVDFSECAIREVCTARSLKPGGSLCQLFHAYFDGVVNEVVEEPVKSTIQPGATECRTQLKFR